MNFLSTMVFLGSLVHVTKMLEKLIFDQSAPSISPRREKNRSPPYLITCVLAVTLTIWLFIAIWLLIFPTLKAISHHGIPRIVQLSLDSILQILSW